MPPTPNDATPGRPRRAVVTGAASGIGAATAQLLAEDGYSVVLVDIDDIKGQEQETQLTKQGYAARFVKVDISNEDSVSGLFEVLAHEADYIDTLVNVAGYLRSGDVATFDVGLWDRIFAVNVRGSFLMVKHAVPLLRNSIAGSIVNVSSLAYTKAAAGHTAYAASKGALVSFTGTLAAELSEDGIRVNAVAPGWVDTPFNDPAIAHMGGPQAQASLIEKTVPMKRQGTPREIATAIAFAISPAASFMTGQTILIDGGASV